MGVGGFARTVPPEKVQEPGTRQRARMSPRFACVLAVPPLVFLLGKGQTFGEPLLQGALVNTDRTAMGIEELAPDVPQLRCNVATLDDLHEYDDNALLEV